jgi:hypothetical protein
MSETRASPRRFVDVSGRPGQLLRRVLAEQELGQALPRFVDVRERGARRSRLRRLAVLLTTSLLASLVVGLLQRDAEAPAIRPELVSARARHDVSSAAVLVAQQPDGASHAPQPPPAKPGLDKPKPRAASAVHRERPRAAPAARETGELTGAKACAEIARGGAAEEAIACYEKLASGSGVSAELALFEQARLAGKMLDQPERALLTLQRYRERFPHGALRAEVMLAQIDWLVTSGQSSRALALVDEALRSGLLQERATELEQARSRLQRELAAPSPR